MGWFSSTVKGIGNLIVGGARATGRGLAGITVGATPSAMRGARAAIFAKQAENLVKGVGGAGLFVGASVLAFFGVKAAASWLESAATLPEDTKDFWQGVGWLVLAGGAVAIGTGVFIALKKVR